MFYPKVRYKYNKIYQSPIKGQVRYENTSEKRSEVFFIIYY